MDLSNENIIHVKCKNIEYLQFRKLLEFENVVNCYTLSVNNVDFKMDYPKEQTDNLNRSYEKICDELKIKKESIVRPFQTHSDNIEIVNDIKNEYNNVDRVINKQRKYKHYANIC